MSSEIYWLVLVTIYSTLLFVPYAVYRIGKAGFMSILINPVPGDEPFDVEWAHRSYRAHMNSLENLISFAVVVFALELTGGGNATTAMAAQVYFWARLIHAPFYVVKTPFVRTIAYFFGLGATLVMAFELLDRTL